MRAKQANARRRVLQALALTATAAALPTARAQAPGGGWLVVTHKVADFERWKAVFDGAADLKRGFGWRATTIYEVDGDRNHVLVMEEFESLAGAKRFAASPQLKEAMGKAGVLGPPEIRFATAVARARA